MAFERRWSDELKRAVIVAQLDHGMTAAQASQAAHDGELPGIGRGVPKAPIGVAYCRDLASEERRRRKQVEKAREAPGEIVAQGMAQLAAIFDSEVQRAVAQSRRGRVDAAKIIALAKSGQELAKLARLAQQPGKAEPAGKPEPEAERDFIGGLAGS
jgi:hypothetical protein